MEHFYEMNGYRPVEYLVKLPAGCPVRRHVGYDVVDVRDLGGQTLINIASDRGSDAQAKAAVRRRWAERPST